MPVRKPAGHRTVDDIVVDEGRHVDELQDDSDFQVIFIHATERTTDEDRQGGADAFARGIANVTDIRLHRRIEGADLVADRGLDPLQLGADKLERKPLATALKKSGGAHGDDACEKFHKVWIGATPMTRSAGKIAQRHGV